MSHDHIKGINDKMKNVFDKNDIHTACANVADSSPDNPNYRYFYDQNRIV